MILRQALVLLSVLLWCETVWAQSRTVTGQVTDVNGNVYDVFVEVVDSKGGYVAVQLGTFTATDAGGYTITYAVVVGNQTIRKTTAVTVTGASQNDVTLGATFDKLVTVGQSVAIRPTVVPAGTSVTASVKRGDTEIAVVDNAFTPDTVGVYDVTLSAAGAADYTYSVYARAAMKKGEVETFDADWTVKEAFIEGKRTDWQIVSTAESGLQDRYAADGTFAKIEQKTAGETVRVYLDVRGTVEDYTALAKEGYGYVSLWLYIDADGVFAARRLAAAGWTAGVDMTLVGGRWVEVRFNLVAGVNQAERSFAEAIPYYAEQAVPYLELNNLPAGANVYLDSMYAHKALNIAVENNVTTALHNGDMLTPAEYFVAADGVDLQYVLSGGGTAKTIAGTEKLTATGSYTLSAQAADRTYGGNASVALDVTDENVSFAAQRLSVSFDGTPVSVDLAQLHASFTHTDGTDVSVTAYSVAKLGKAYPLTGTAFTADVAGFYTVTVTGRYTADNTEYTVSETAVVEVVDESKPYVYLDQKDMASRYWLRPNSDAVTGKTVTSQTEQEILRGRTGNYLKVTDTDTSAHTLVICLIPEDDRDYYIGLASAGYVAYYDYYIDYDGVMTSGDGSYTAGVWQTGEIDLNRITGMNEYGSERDNIFKGLIGKEWGHSHEAWNYAFRADVSASESTATVYIGNVRIERPVDSSQAEVALKTGETVAAGENNKLGEKLSAKIGDKDAEITAIRVQYDGKTVALEGPDFDFYPTFGGSYSLEVSLRAGTSSTTRTVAVTVTGENEKPTPVTDDGFYRLVGDESLAVSSIQGLTAFGDAIDSVEITVYRLSYGGNAVNKTVATDVTATVLDGNIVLTGLTDGDYALAFVQTEASGTAPFNTALLTEITLYYDSSETFGILADTEPQVSRGEAEFVRQTPDGIDGAYWKLTAPYSDSLGYEVRFATVHGAAYYRYMVEKEGYAFRYDAYATGTANGDDRNMISFDPYILALDRLTKDVLFDTPSELYPPTQIGNEIVLNGWILKQNVVLYFGNFRLEKEAQEVQLQWTGAAATLASGDKLGERMTATLDGQSATVVRATLIDDAGNETVLANDLTVPQLFGGAYRLTVVLQSAQYAKTETVNVTVTGLTVTAASATEVIDGAYTLQIGQLAQIELSKISGLPSEYTVTYVAKRADGSTMCSGAVRDTTSIEYNENGRYTVELTLTVGGASKLFFTQTVCIVSRDAYMSAVTDNNYWLRPLPEGSHQTAIVDAETQTESIFAARTGKYLSVTTASEGARTESFIVLQPSVCDRAYWEELYKAGYTVLFDYYIDTEQAICPGHKDWHGNETALQTKQWQVGTIDLVKITNADYWAGLIGGWYESNVRALQYGVNADASSAEDFTVYIGNVRVEKAVSGA